MRLFRRTTRLEISWRDYRALKKYGRLSIGASVLLILSGFYCFIPAVAETLSQPDWMGDWMSATSVRWLCMMIGFCFTGTGLLCMRLRLLLFRSRQVIAEENLPEVLAADAETVDTVMRKREIQPRLILNGKRFYKRSDFGDMPLLLRPSQAPQPEKDTLLRSAPRDHDAPQENLLRPVTVDTLDATVSNGSSRTSE